MKKKILALLMVFVMVFGLNSIVLAAPSSVGDNEHEMEEIEASWDTMRQRTIRVENFLDDGASSVRYHYILYYNNEAESMGTYYFNASTASSAVLKDKYVYISFLDKIKKTGDYHVELLVEEFYLDEKGEVDENKTKKYIATTDVKTCIIPDKKLETPMNVRISKDGIMTFDLVEGAAYYEIILRCYCEACTSEENGINNTVDGFMLEPETGATKGSFNLLSYLKEDYLYDGDYTLSVCAISENLDMAKDSEWSEESNVYKFRLSGDQVKEKLDTALESEYPSDGQWILATTDNATLVELLKDVDFVKKVKKVEEAYVAENKITIKETKSEVANIDGSKVTIIGAALNAGYGDEVQLTIAEPTTKVNIAGIYSNAVQLDIKLMVNGEYRTDLFVPVTITMPIPSDVEKENLIILHYHEEGKNPKVITPIVNADGTMTFVVDGFSTFVVANSTSTAGTDTIAPKTADTANIMTVCVIVLFIAIVSLGIKKAIDHKKKSVIL